jgi:hypothetical protein
MAPIVHEKLLAILDVNVISGLAPLHIMTVGEFVTTGTGSTVMVVETKQPVPIEYFIVEVPAETPVTMPPASTVATPVVPLLQVPPAVISLRLVVEPAHTSVVPVNAAGNGSTVTAIVKGDPAHEVVVAVGMMIYSTVPVEVWLGLVRI